MPNNASLPIFDFDIALRTTQAREFLKLEPPELRELIVKGEIPVLMHTDTRHPRFSLRALMEYRVAAGEKRREVYEEALGVRLCGAQVANLLSVEPETVRRRKAIKARGNGTQGYARFRLADVVAYREKLKR